jgi:hypothetical protein
MERDDAVRPTKRHATKLLCRSDTGCAYSTRFRLSIVVAIAFSSLSAGCGSQATIVLRNGNTVQGRIVEKRDAFLVAENDDHGVFGVPEQHVKEVRHPGKGAMIAGGVLVGAAALLTTAALLTDCSDRSGEGMYGTADDNCEVGRGFSFLFAGASAATGIGVGLYGIGVNADSEARARGPREGDRGARRVNGNGFGFVARF